MGTLSLIKQERIYNGEKTVSNKWENWIAMYKRMKLEHFITSYTKINSKWIRDLNVRLETLKRSDETLFKGRTFFDINCSKTLYDPPPRVTEIKTKISKWGLIKFISF